MPSPLRLLLLALASLVACAGEESAPPDGSPGASGSTAAAFSLPDVIELGAPTRPIEHLETVEDLSEEVADALLDFSAELTRRDFEKAGSWIADDFAGHGWGALPVAAEETLPLGATRLRFDTSAAPILGRDAFMTERQDLLGPFARVELAKWKVKRAEFESGARPWGVVHLFVHVIGESGQGREEWSIWADARVEKRRGRWQLVRLALESAAVARVERRAFVEVGGAAGLAHLGVRFGKPGNTEDAWQGAAAGDVDGDGDFDLFVPSGARNFLYLAQPHGGFDEVAQERGVALPAGGTGTVFFDYDNDGDQDLFVAHRAHATPAADGGDERWEGETLHLYANDGRGQFSDVSAALGLDVRRYGFSVSVLDYDQDGWLDLFVASYGRVGSEHNNSWIEATNGKPNALFRNLEGRGFEDVAPALGIAGTSWSYACAVADYDGDGDSDLYVANDYGTNRLWQNEGGTFRDVAPELGVQDQGNGMGVSWGDLDSDGRLDLYVSNMSSTAGKRILGRLSESLDPELHAQLSKAAAGNTVFLAGDGGFERQPASAGGVGANWAWSAALTDLDLDGALDVFCVNGFVTGDLPQDT